MTKNAFFSVIALVLAVCLLAPGCGKSDKTKEVETGDNVGLTLLNALNKSPLGMTLEVEPANVKVTPEGNRSLVTFSDVVFHLDTSKYNFLLKDNPIKLSGEKITAKMKEWVFRYGPEEKYLDMVSCTGITAELDMFKLMEFPAAAKKKGMPKSMPIKMSIGKMGFVKGGNFSAIIEPGKNLEEILTTFISNATYNESMMKDFAMSFDVEEGGKRIAFEMSIDEAEGKQHNSKLQAAHLIKGEYDVNAFDALMKEGKAVFDVSAKMKGLKVKVLENGEELGSGKLDAVTFSYSMKPVEDNTAFRFGYDFDLTGLTMNAPKLPVLAIAGNLKQWKMNASLEPISPRALVAYLKFNRQKDNFKTMPPEEAQKVWGEFMGEIKEFIAGKPTIKLSIDPLHHAMGEIALNGEMHWVDMDAPIAKGELVIKDFNGMIENLKNANLIPSDQIEGAIGFFKSFMTIDEQGNATASIEKKDKDPKVYVNGKPLPF